MSSTKTEWDSIELEKDSQNRKVHKSGKDMDVYLMTLTFKDPWDKDTATKSIKEFVDAIHSVPEEGIIYPIINTQGKNLSFNVEFMNLLGVQKRMGSQILVQASHMVESLGNVFATVGSDLHFVDTLKEAEDLRESLISKGKVVVKEEL
ncbi:MAG: hypothetical protein ABIM99_01505 [Candidatus Dojkabacteria bacterium]